MIYICINWIGPYVALSYQVSLHQVGPAAEIDWKE